MILKASGEIIPITLSVADWNHATRIAADRQLRAITNGYRHRYGADPANGFQYAMIGALAECAVAIHFNVFWSERGITAPDVGAIEVRASSYPDSDLKLHPGDRDEAPFVLAIAGTTTTVHLVGWIYGREGKRREYWRAIQPGRPCYVVPRAVLRPMRTLTRAEVVPITADDIPF